MIISDHAIVRYLERFCGLESEVIKKSISEKMKKYGGVDGVFSFDESTNLQAVVRNGVLVTFLEKEEVNKSNFQKLNSAKVKKIKKSLGNQKTSKTRIRDYKLKKEEAKLADLLYSGSLPDNWEE